MNDEKILEVYQRVRSRYNFFNYWKATIEADEAMSAGDQLSKADKAFNDDVVVAFAKEIALWWGAES